MFMAVLTLLVALAISGVAAWYSIVGLMAIFAAAAIPIAIMGGVLEAGKLLTASWLYQNWNVVPRLLKYYLTVAVVVLMFITSMGIFGFLSKAHIDQTLSTGDNSLLIAQIDNKIQREQRRVDDAEKVIAQLDEAVQVLMEYDRIRGPEGAIAVRESQKEERRSLNDIIDSASSSIATLQRDKLELDSEQLKLEAEVGPIKYIAGLFYEETNKSVLEEAVRYVILTIIFVFDPLAVLLIIAANISLNQTRKPKKMVEVVDATKEWSTVEAEAEDRGDVFAEDIEDEVHEIEKKDKYEKEAREWLDPEEIIKPEQSEKVYAHQVDKFHGIEKKPVDSK